MMLNCSISTSTPGKRLWQKPRAFDSLEDFARWACEAFNDRTTVQAYEGDQLLAYVEVLNRTHHLITRIPY